MSQINISLMKITETETLQRIEVSWRIYAALNWAISGSDKDLLAVPWEGWTNEGVLMIGSFFSRKRQDCVYGKKRTVILGKK